MMNCYCKEISDKAKTKMSDVLQKFEQECETITKKYSNIDKDLEGTEFSDPKQADELFDDIAMRMYLDISKLRDDLKRSIARIEYESSYGRAKISRHMKEEDLGSHAQVKFDIEYLTKIGIDEISYYEEMGSKFSAAIKKISSTNDSIIAIKAKLGLLTE